MKRNSTKLIYPTTEEKHLIQDLREGEKRGKSIDRERKQTTKGGKRKREKDVFMHNNCSNHATTNNKDAHYIWPHNMHRR
jgi:hypothetical protein